MCKKRFFLSLVSILSFFFLNAQESQEIYTLSEMNISGNKWTKEQVIIRELNFRLNDKATLQSFFEKQEESEERLKNIGIFNDAIIEYVIIDSLTNQLKCNVLVVENWYIYPGITLDLADRNFSEWWFNQDRDLSRTNYGLRLNHINITGRRDRLLAQFQLGFRQKYEIIYNLPYLTNDGNWGAEAFIYYSNQNELPYKTENNRTIFGGKEDEILLERFRTGMAVFHRPDIYNHHAFRLEFHQNSVDQFVIDSLNPSYFLEDRTSIKFFYFNYHYTLDKRIAQFYPIDGYLFFADFKKEGFKIFDEYNNTALMFGAEYYHSLTPRLILGLTGRIKANLDRRVVSFANNSALGWGDNILGGYNLYVIDGTDYLYTKNNLRYKLFERKLQLNWMPLRQFSVMHVQLHARAFLDAGYVNERTYSNEYNNDFSNRLLYGYGPAIDLLLFNNYMFSMNVGRNHTKELDYFFQFRTNF